MNKRYIIITPVRDEQSRIEKTLASVCSQKIRPAKWIIVDDGSCDNTRDIVRGYIRHNPWIELCVKVSPDNERGLGQPVIEAFNQGLEKIDLEGIDFITKIDGDVSFKEDYFRALLYKFEENPRLGISGGVTYVKIGDELVPENTDPGTNVQGAVKMYRKKCFSDIEGIVPILGWDHIDQIKARMKGWDTGSFPELKVLHHRRMGSSIDNIFKGKMRWGKTSHAIGSHPLFVLAKGMYHIFQRPYIIGGLSFFAGYIIASFSKMPVYRDRGYIKFLHQYELSRLKKMVIGGRFNERI